MIVNYCYVPYGHMHANYCIVVMITCMLDVS